MAWQLLGPLSLVIHKTEAKRLIWLLNSHLNKHLYLKMVHIQVKGSLVLFSATMGPAHTAPASLTFAVVVPSDFQQFIGS